MTSIKFDHRDEKSITSWHKIDHMLGKLVKEELDKHFSDQFSIQWHQTFTGAEDEGLLVIEFEDAGIKAEFSFYYPDGQLPVVDTVALQKELKKIEELELVKLKLQQNEYYIKGFGDIEFKAPRWELDWDQNN